MKHGRYNVWEVDKCDRLFRLESVRGKCFVAFFSPHSWERDFFFLMNLLNRHLIFECLYTTNAVPQFHYLIWTYFYCAKFSGDDRMTISSLVETSDLPYILVSGGAKITICLVDMTEFPFPSLVEMSELPYSWLVEMPKLAFFEPRKQTHSSVICYINSCLTKISNRIISMGKLTEISLRTWWKTSDDSYTFLIVIGTTHNIIYYVCTQLPTP
jgi:hypothetical protein